MLKGWLKPKAAARYCDIGERTLRTWLKEEGLRHVRIRGTILIKTDWVDEFLSVREVGTVNVVGQIVSDVCKEMNL